MATTLNIPRVTRPLEESENYAFSFVKKEDKYTLTSEKRNTYIEKVGGLKPTWIIMSIVLVFAFIGLGIYEAFTAKTAIAFLVDPDGNGNVPAWVLSSIGAALSILGMMIGHSIFEHTENDEYTGRRNLGAMFYLSIIGAIIYVGTQFFIVKIAGEGVEEFKYLPYLVVAIALLELIVGGLLLGKVLTYLLIFYLAFRIYFLHKGMRSKSKATNSSYRDYRALRDAYNIQNQANTLVLEGNDNIRRAIAYYSGINLNNVPNYNTLATPIIPVENVQPANRAIPNPQPTNNPVTENTQQQVQEQPNVRLKQQQNTTEEEVERFINDDDNLTL